MGNLSLYADLGYYFFKKNKEHEDPSLFQRIGFRYQINKHLFGGLGIKAFSFHKADYVEFRLGYTVLNKKINKF